MNVKSAALRALPASWRRWDARPRRVIRSLKAAAGHITPTRYRAIGAYYYRALLGTLDPEMRLLLDAIRPGSFAIDIGANIGVYSYAMRRRGAVVQAFEPHPGAFSVLRTLRGVSVHAEALGDTIGTMTFYVPVIDGRPETEGTTSVKPTGESQRITAPVTPLDRFAFTNVSAIKIDVEGAEDAVLRGAEDTIRRERPVIVVEVEARHRTLPVTDVFDWFRVRGYNGVWFAGSEERSVDRFDARLHQSATHDPTSPKYVNNFLFRHGSMMR